MSRGGGGSGGLIGTYVIGPIVDVIKVYFVLILVVFFISGAAAAAAVAGKVAVAGGYTVGFGIGGIGPFVSSLTKAQDMVKSTDDKPKTQAKATPKKSGE